jgi:peptidoglycan hydrolase-like protein with peptidoglycan-binding domain
VNRRLLLGAALLAIVAGGAAAVLSGGSGGGSATAEGTAGATGSGRVERRTLAERLTVGGTIGYAGEATVLARLAGTLTALPKVGDIIERGQELYALGGEPVLLMYGAVPAYRDLKEGADEGPDVEQLEENLVALGYEPGTIDEEFTSSTATAVSAWQEDLGLEATGAVELGRVAFLPGPRRVTKVEATLGESIGSSGGGGLASGPAAPGEATLVAYEVPALEEAAESPAGEEPADPEAEEEEPEAEKKPKPEEEEEEEEEEEVPSNESRPASPNQAEASPEESGEGEEADPASVAVLETSSTRRIVSVELDPDQQSVTRRGQRVEVLLPGGEEARGKVRRIAASEGSGEGVPGEETEPGVEVTVSIVGKTKVPELDGAAVSVLFTQQVRKHVLSVPLIALVAVSGERFAVVGVEGSRRRRIVVTPGLAADGYVEVEGKGLRAGMTVETGE